MATTVFASEQLATGKFVVSLYASENQKPWVARAIEQNIYNDLAGYARVIPAKKSKLERERCVTRDIDCVLTLYKSLEIDALLIGEVHTSSIDFKVYNVQKKSLVKTGSISIGRGANLLQLRMDTFASFKPFLAKGGILERQQFGVKAKQEDNTPQNDQYSNEFKSLINPIVIAILIVTWLPYIFSFFGKPLRNKRRTKVILSWFFPFQLLSFVVPSILYLSQFKIVDNVIEFFHQSQWLFMALAGLVWSYFIITNLRIIHPHPQGLERVGQRNILPLLRAYLLTFSLKLLILVLIYAVVFYLSTFVGKSFGLEEKTIVIAIFPLMGLYALYWIGLMLEVMAMSLDVRLSGSNQDQQKIWSQKLRKYFVSYLKRNGVSLDENLLNKLIFLAGEKERVYCYGGFLSQPRIVVGIDLIKEALGDNDNTIKLYQRKEIDQSQVSQFIPHIFPSINEPKRPVGKRRRSAIFLGLNALFHYSLNKDHDNCNLGQDSVMKGVVIPKFEGYEDLPSLMSDNLDDMSIVDALMQEDSAKSDPFDEDAEIDDSSENDKDFLFGLLIHKFGELLRYDHVFSTFYLYFFAGGKKEKLGYRFPFAKYFSRVADTFVVVHFGLYHFMQYLHMCATDQKSYLTTRATSNILLESQNIVLLDTREAVEQRQEKINRCDYFDRLVWLSNFCDETIVVKKNILLQKGAKVMIVAIGLYFLVATLVVAYNYQFEYQSIIENERREIAEMMKEAQVQQGENNDSRK